MAGKANIGNLHSTAARFQLPASLSSPKLPFWAGVGGIRVPFSDPHELFVSGGLSGEGMGLQRMRLVCNRG